MAEAQNNDNFGTDLGHTKDEWGIKKKEKKLINQIIESYKLIDE
jgi:hypothetical protein|tara:strand:- start:486 stop:617 length:132 start_codon:yes stop_codon:yes gene_type:complete